MAIGQDVPRVVPEGAALARDGPRRAERRPRRACRTRRTATTSSCGRSPPPPPSGPSCWPRRCAAAFPSSGCTRPPRSTRGSSTRCWPIVEAREWLTGRAPHDLSRAEWKRVKRLGFSDAQLAYLWSCTEAEAAGARHAAGVEVTYKTVDTCAAEFAANTPYHYGTYEDEDEVAPLGRPAVVILGSGPNRIGQGVEFDYCCVHAAFALHRRRLRDGDGQLQPGDGVDRLRHERPPLLRAAHGRGRARRSAAGSPSAATSRASWCRSAGRRR